MPKQLLTASILCLAATGLSAQTNSDNWTVNNGVASITSFADTPGGPMTMNVVCDDQELDLIMTGVVANPISFEDGLALGFRAFVDFAVRDLNGELGLMGYTAVRDRGVDQFAPVIEFTPGQYTFILNTEQTNAMLYLMERSAAMIIDRADNTFDRDNASETTIRDIFALSGFMAAVNEVRSSCGM